MARLPSSFRHHLHFIIIVPLLIIVMTWPTIVYVFDTDTVWLPSASNDVFFKIWDVWYGRQVLEGRADLLYTDLQFFPRGMSLVYHQFAIPHMIAVSVLQAVMPLSNAYNLCYLLMLFLNASSTYLLLMYIFRDKWISLFGAALVGVSPYFLLSNTLPDLTLMTTLPLATYFFLRSINEQRLAFALFSGLAAGVTAFVSMFMFVCTVLMLGIYGCFFALSRWTDRRFWLRIAILLCALGSVSMIRIGPMIADRDSFNEAADKNEEHVPSVDLLAFFVSSRNPIVSPLFEKALGIPPVYTLTGAYLGYVPLLLVLLGLASNSHRRKMLPWLVILVIFLLLRLGETLTINTVQYPDVVLPKRLLDQMFPALFRPFWSTGGFQVGVFLPLAVLSCYGLSAVTKLVSPRHAVWLVMALVALTAVEYFDPMDGRVIAKGQTRLIEWLKTEEQDSIRLINFPMGRGYSKYYGFLQSIGGFPHAEGAANRTLREAYSYIDANPLLSAWRNQKNLHCFPPSMEAFDDALDQLFSTGFTHFVYHRWLNRGAPIRFSFQHAKPAYEDDYVTIYRLQDLRGRCQHTAFLSSSVLPQLKASLPPSTIRLGDGASVVSIHPAGNADGDIQRFYSRILQTSPDVFPLTVDDLAPSLPDPSEQEIDAERMLMNNSFMLLAYDPQATAPDLINAYTGWIASRFKSCGQLVTAGNAYVQYFAKDHVPCDLLTADNPLAVSYENGMKLANALLQFDGEQLDLHLLWERLPRKLHSVSLQVFDEADTKIKGFDRTIPNEPVIDLRLDLSYLGPGDYIAKLIVYDYETGVSVSGTVTSSDTRFDRELEIARLTID